MKRRRILILAGTGGVAWLAGCIDRIAGLQSPDLRAETSEEAVRTYWQAVEEVDRDAIVAVTEEFADLYFEYLELDDYDEYMEREVETISHWELLQVNADLTLEEIVEDKFQPRDVEHSIQDYKNAAERTAAEVGATDYESVYTKIEPNEGSNGTINASPILDKIDYAYEVDGYWYEGPILPNQYFDDRDR